MTPQDANKDAAAAVRADRGPLPAYIPSVGDRVRIVLEGEVTSVRPDLGYGVGLNWITPSAAHVVSVEKLPDPEPTWERGDVVRCANPDHDNDPYIRNHRGEWVSSFRTQADGALDGCPLRLLVRGGETVAAGGGNG